MIALKNVLVATDFGEAADVALTYGRTLARTFGGTLHVLHVLDNVFMRSMVADPHVLEAAALKHLHERLSDEDRRDLDATVVAEMSDAPAEVIVRYARTANIDLIVMGTHGRRAIGRLLVGSVAERVVRTAPCPVLTIRHPEREFIVPDVAAEQERHEPTRA